MDIDRRQLVNQVASLSRKLSWVESRLMEKIEESCATVEQVKELLSKPMKMVLETSKGKEVEKDPNPPPPGLYI